MTDGYMKRARRRVLGYPRWIRIVAGLALVLGGIFGFLPVIGFWMIPLGMLVLSYDLPRVRRWRRRLEVWWGRRRERARRLRAEAGGPGGRPQG